MALPGVRTTLKDRFYTLSRTDIPDGIRVAAIARRDADTDGDTSLPPNYDAYQPRSEQEVITSFGEGSELHRAYLELVSAGAARIDLIPVPNIDDTSLFSTAAGNPLERAFEAVEVAQSDIVVPWGRGSHPTEFETPATPGNDNPNFGFHANNSTATTTSLAKRVADYCSAISGRQNACFAVMGVKPYTGEANSDGSITASNFSDFIGASGSPGGSFTNLIGRDSENMSDNGHFLSVVHTEVKPTGYNSDWGFANGAATYAGFVSSLDSEIAATGRSIFNLSSLRYSPTRTQQSFMIDQGLVPVALNSLRAAVVIDAQTYGRSASDYARLTTLRIVFDAVQLVRQTCETYIGKPATTEHRNAMETAIGSRLRSMTIAGALFDSDFTTTYIPRENKILIDLVLRPAFEIRNIEVSVSVQL